MKKHACLLLFFLSVVATRAQVKDTSFSQVQSFHTEIHQFGIVTGVQQFKNTFFELGIYSLSGTASKCAFGSGFTAISFTGLYNPFAEVAGADLSLWSNAAFMIQFGAGMNAYTDFEAMVYGLKPQVGIGGMRFSFIYGFNFMFGNSASTIEGVNTNTLTLRFNILIKGDR